MTTSETIIARFTVVGWDPEELPAIDGGWLDAVTMRKTYTSGLVGASIAHFVSSGSEETGRGYLAAERIAGTLTDGRRGEFTVHHGGTQGPGANLVFGHIIPGTGTEDFADFAGEAIISHDDGGAYFAFTLTR